jgi:hypothetical protein
MDHTQHERLDAAQLTEATLTGATIYDQNDYSVGTISHVHGMGQNLSVVADVGTFLGMFGKSVVIPASALSFMRDDQGTVHAVTSWTKDQIERLPEHGED